MNIQPEFSYFVSCEKIKEAAKTFEIEACEAERSALAKRFDLLQMHSLMAKAQVTRGRDDVVHLHCEWSSEIVQECVVTGKPLTTHKNCTFEQTFSASAEPYFGDEKEPVGEGEYSSEGFDDEVPDPLEPMIDGGFDLGECVAEQLSLEIDPFPRSADANFEGFSSSGDDEGSDGKANPFAILEQLKKKS